MLDPTIWQHQVNVHDKLFITALVLSAEHLFTQKECHETSTPKPVCLSFSVTYPCLLAAKQAGVVCLKDQSSFKCMATPCLHMISRRDALVQVSQRWLQSAALPTSQFSLRGGGSSCAVLLPALSRQVSNHLPPPVLGPSPSLAATRPWRLPGCAGSLLCSASPRGDVARETSTCSQGGTVESSHSVRRELPGCVQHQGLWRDAGEAISWVYAFSLSEGADKAPGGRLAARRSPRLLTPAESDSALQGSARASALLPLHCLCSPRSKTSLPRSPAQGEAQAGQHSSWSSELQNPLSALRGVSIAP